MIGKLHAFLGTTIAIATVPLHAQPLLQYVPAALVQCQYGSPPFGLSASVVRTLPTQGLLAVVRASVDAQGKVTDAVLVRSSEDPMFDDIALRKSQLAICNPFTGTDGKPVAIETEFQFSVLRTDAFGSFAKKVRQRIRPNIVWDGKDRNLETLIAVRCEPDGRLLEATIAQSSGNSEWDSAALQAVLRSAPMPADDDGKTPAKFKLTIRPGPN
ncbi:MAG TPA: TonB family protein [Paraburkholderia sp.]